MWPAPADLAPYITGLHLYVVDENDGQPNRGVFEPSGAALRIAVVGGDTWRVCGIDGIWHRPGSIALFGPSRAIVRSESGPGVLLNGGLRPRGWLRLVRDPASAWADRSGQPAMLSGRNGQEALNLFRALADDEAVADIYFTLIRSMLGPQSADESTVAMIEALLLDPSVRSVAQMGERAGLSIRQLQRQAARAFGLPPKLLLRRARFLRSLNALRAVPRGEGAIVIDPAYTDYSHFVRDAQDFLGMPPQAFVENESPLLRRALAMRADVIGSPSQVLDPVPGQAAAFRRRA